MLYFCTLFDSNYLTRGLATYESLAEVCKGGFQLYVFAFDDRCYAILKQLNLPNLIPISLTELEDEQLLRIKPTRSRGEYCWTCTSSTILYAIKTYKLPHCTYIDADMIFYNDPKVLIEEIPKDCNVLITEHRYTKQYDKSKIAGKYCVQFMYFDNTDNGLHILNWWRNQCLEWCYNRIEDGKFGDQKYLDDWTTRFKGVHVLQHLGGGLAPWNIQQYQIYNDKVLIHKGLNKKNITLQPIFFHFHGVKLYEKGKVIFAPKMYLLSDEIKKQFYEPYIQKLNHWKLKMDAMDSTFDANGTQSLQQYQRDKWKGWGAYFKTNFIKKYFIK
jgi:hypothetical protein